MDNLPSKYEKEYSESNFWSKLKKFAKQAGLQVVYLALLLYYLLEDKQTPTKAKVIIASALGYFILPTDLIPDFIIGVGFADDLGALMLALGQVIEYLKAEHKSKSRTKLKEWFSDYDEQEIDDLDKKMNS